LIVSSGMTQKSHSLSPWSLLMRAKLLPAMIVAAFSLLIMFTRQGTAGVKDVDVQKPAVSEHSAQSITTRISGKGVLICTGKKAKTLLECSNETVTGVRIDIYSVTSNGWRLIQIIPDENSGLWHYFFQH